MPLLDCSLYAARTCHGIRYNDTKGYIYVRSKADDMAILVYRTAQKRKIKKTKNKNRVAQKKRCGQKSVK